MAECAACGQEMMDRVGCTKKTFDDFIDGVVRVRVPYGSKVEGWEGRDSETPERCHDCGVGLGEYHHPGCDMERCPSCGEQAIACECVGAAGAERNLCAKWGTDRSGVLARISGQRPAPPV